MGTWTPERAAEELLSVLPLLTRIVAATVRCEVGEDTTMPQFRVLAHLAEGPLTVSDLARRRRVTLQSMGQIVQTLVERGWVTRAPSAADRRQQLLTLTDRGRAQYERVQARAIEQIAPLLARLEPAELAAVQAALPALRRVLAGDDHAGP